MKRRRIQCQNMVLITYDHNYASKMKKDAEEEGEQ